MHVHKDNISNLDFQNDTNQMTIDKHAGMCLLQGHIMIHFFVIHNTMTIKIIKTSRAEDEHCVAIVMSEPRSWTCDLYKSVN